MKTIQDMTCTECEKLLDMCRDYIERVIGPDAYLNEYCEAPDIFAWLKDDGRFDHTATTMYAAYKKIQELAKYN